MPGEHRACRDGISGLEGCGVVGACSGTPQEAEEGAEQRAGVGPVWAAEPEEQP